MCKKASETNASVAAMQLFQAGDRVKCAFFGDAVFTLILGYYDSLAFNHNGNLYHFWSDGKDDSSHTHPVLTLVERPKKKVKVTYHMASYTDTINVTKTARFTSGFRRLEDLHGFLRYSDINVELQYHTIEREEYE